MKRIGILTHCVANNFGANLQAFSTGCYLRNHGYEPIFISWIDYISNNTPTDQVAIHRSFLSNHGFVVTSPCYTDDDFLQVISEYSIKNIIVGSDCVLTYNSVLFPYRLTRRGLVKVQNSKDYNFPNPFWLSYIKNRGDICKIMMSASCGGSGTGYIKSAIKCTMKELLAKFDYISVRDEFTKKFVKSLLPNNSCIPITPDPVFAFNSNIDDIPSKEQIVAKYSLPEKYIIVSFYKYFWPNQEWANKLMNAAHEYGIQCVSVPMPQGGKNSNFDIDLELPLDPLDWYSLIKYSNGYVGNNMHPIIVALHNNVPFFSYNIHGRSLFNGRIQFLKTSKEYDLLHKYSLDHYLAPQPYINFISPKKVIEKLVRFDFKQCQFASEQQQKDYQIMMNQIINHFK